MTDYNTTTNRQLLSEGLSDEAIDILCFDYFRPVYEQLAVGMSKGQKIQRLIEYCERQNRIPHLLEAIKEVNPAKYVQYESRLSNSSSESVSYLSTAGSQAEKLASLKRQLVMAERVLAVMERRVAGYSELSMPLDLAVNLEDQREKVAELRRQIAAIEDTMGRWD
jgi:hypothetical protein